MTRQHRRSNDGNSLDLFLDAICNTFGGVLFISVLVIIIINTTAESVTSRLPDKNVQADLVQLEIKRDALHERLRKLRRGTAERTKAVQKFATAESIRLAEQLTIADDEHARALQEKSRTLGELSRTQIEINKILKRRKMRRDAILETRKKIASAQQSAAKVVKAHSRQIVLPKLHTTDKSPVEFFLKGNVLYSVRQAPRHRSKYEILKLSDEIRKVQRGRQILVEPKPGAGVRIDAGNPDLVSVRSRFDKFSPENRYVKIFVWNDSFKTFTLCRRALVELGFEYSLILMQKDEKIHIGTQATQDFVQ